jgi:recombination protein RecR
LYPDPLKRLLAELGRLPGVGPRTAERFAFHLLKAPAGEANALADAIREVKTAIRPCPGCGTATEAVAERCAICADPARDATSICVVEQPKDLYALGLHRGVYCVLMGAVALLDGVDERHLNLRPLEARIAAGGVREVILALNPNLDGDATALHLAERLRAAARERGFRITRIARGVGAGTTLADAPRAVLEDAYEERRALR